MAQGLLFSKSFELLDLHPVVSPENSARVAGFEAAHSLKLPVALPTWFSLENSDAILEKIAIPHDAVDLRTVYAVQQYHAAKLDAKAMLPVLFENQGMWQLAARLNGGDDPPVDICYNEPDEHYQPHAPSFSEWVYALAWDYAILEHKRGRFVLDADAEQLGT